MSFSCDLFLSHDTIILSLFLHQRVEEGERALRRREGADSIRRA